MVVLVSLWGNSVLCCVPCPGEWWSDGCMWRCLSLLVSVFHGRQRSPSPVQVSGGLTTACGGVCLCWYQCYMAGRGLLHLSRCVVVRRLPVEVWVCWYQCYMAGSGLLHLSKVCLLFFPGLPVFIMWCPLSVRSWPSFPSPSLSSLQSPSPWSSPLLVSPSLSASFSLSVFYLELFLCLLPWSKDVVCRVQHAP